jgi:type III pantothenate kinase
MSLYLLIDVGNTRLKWAAVESTQSPTDRQKKMWAYSGSVSSQSLKSPESRAELSEYIAKTIPEPDVIAYCCVAGSMALDGLQMLFPQWGNIPWKQLRGDSSFIGIRTLYQNPERLGADRWAAILGARALSSSNSLVMSMGTASTIDLLGANGLHYGGWILPGLNLMQESLQSNTAQLPLAVRDQALNTPCSFGTNTEDAIIQGCEAAQIGALQRAMQLAKEMQCPIERIWLDGGNAKMLAQQIRALPPAVALPVELIDSLVLRGLWVWLLQNN